MPRSVVCLFVSLLVTIGLASCKNTNPVAPTPPPVVLQSLTEITYDSTTATVSARGLLQTPDATPLTVINFHTTSTCGDTPTGRGIAKNFSSTGIQLKLPSTVQSNIYLQTNTDSDCYFVGAYDPAHQAPPPPAFSSTSPASPSPISSTPLIFGSTSAATIQVRLFDDASCLHQVGAGAASEFSTVGIQATLQPNQTSSIYAESVESFGHTSNCTLLTTYTHDSSIPAAPSLISVTPASPNSTSTTPAVKGTASADSVGVTIYGDAACSSQLGSGTSADFEGTGITISVPANASTTLYAQARNSVGGKSDCTYLTTYVNYVASPPAPQFASISPSTLSRVTSYPKVTGTITDPLNVVTDVLFFNGSDCGTEIGSGTKAQFLGAGISASAQTNATTTIYAESVDIAGNRSGCTHLVDFTHDTTPPDPPTPDPTQPTTPASPNNQSTTPYVKGSTSADTAQVQLFSDSACGTSIGSGTSSDFSGTGIQVTVPANATTTIYAQSLDQAGNASSCTFLTNYSHSVQAAAAPVFTKTVPASPSNSSVTPWIQGTVSSQITTVKIFNDSSCNNLLGSGSKLAFTTSGIQVSISGSVPSSPTTLSVPIYATASDVYGNTSPCTLLTTYVFDSQPPTGPQPDSTNPTTPASPNNVSTTPMIKGTASADSVSITLYNSAFCSSPIGSGTASDFTGAGIQANLPANLTSTIYAKAFDQAGNGSSCTFLTSYTHDNTPPAVPSFVLPTTPSYSRQVVVGGTSSSDTASVTIYSDSGCLTSLGSATKALFDSIGIKITAAENATTPLYAQAFDQVGNATACTHLMDFVHTDVGPSGLTISANANGTLSLSWSPDFNATRYVVKRSTWSGGPYTVLASANIGNAFTDSSVSNNSTYYYVVASSNSTGTTYDSTEASATATAAAPTAPTHLSAAPGASQIQLSWFGSPTAYSYQIYRGSHSGGPYSLIASGVQSSIYTDTTAANDIPYYYVVVSSNLTGVSSYSNEASAVAKAAPSAPLHLVAVPLSTGVKLYWSSPSYYNQFRIKRGSYSGTYTTIGTSTSNSYTDTSPLSINPPMNNPNYYVVTATWGTSESAASNEVAIADVLGPTVTPNPGNGEVVLKWSTSAATSFNILRSSIPGGPYTSIASGVSGTMYTDSAVTNGSAYYYVVVPTYSGGMQGISSTEVSAIPGSSPSAPTQLTLQVSKNVPTLTWSAPSAYDSFDVLRSGASGGPYVSIGTATSNSFVDFSSSVGMNYYQVKAIWGNSETAASNIVSFRNGVTSSVVATPGISQVALSWSSVSNATGYQISRATVSGGPYSVVGTTSSTTFTDTTVTDGTGYYYVVVAKFSDGTWGQNSSEAPALPGTSKVPSGLTVLSTTSATATLGWVPVPGASSYKIYQATTSGGPYTDAGISATLTHALITGLSYGHDYYFVVTSISSGVESGQSSEIAVKTVPSPGPPTVTPGDGQVSLIWAASSGATSYTVQRSTDGVTFTTVASGLASTSYTDATVTNGTLYFFRVGPVYSGFPTSYSDSSLGVTPGVTPGVPAGLSATTNGDGSTLVLSWARVSGATAYNIKESSVSGGPYSQVIGNTSVTSATITGLTQGQTYYFVVSALNGTVESANSAEIGVVPEQTPPAPSASVDSNGYVDLSWTAVSGAVAYDIQRSSDSVNFTTIASFQSATSFIDNTVTSGASYTYRYEPYFSANIPGAISGTSISVTPGVQPLAPSTLTAETSGSTSAVLSWVSVPGAFSYNLKRGSAAGGPYPVVMSTTGTTISDSGLTPGSSYYYVVTAVNASGVESTNSSEAAVTLVSAPTGVTATAGTNAINLSWTSVSGATGYVVRRGTSSGGPYGMLASGITSSSYTDTSITNGVTYYYVIAASFASGEVSPDSSEVSATGVTGMNLQVPIELTDRSLTSDVSDLTFETSRTSLDPGAYDGTVTYDFEAVVENSDASSRVVWVMDSAGNPVATLTVPASTTSPTRMRVPMSPNASKDTYRLKLEGTSSAGELTVLSSRILVNQTAATRTKIYIPLLTSSQAPSNADASAPIENTASPSYFELPSATIYKRDTSVFSEIDDYNGWELEAVVSTTGAATGSVVLYNLTEGAPVGDTQTVFSGNSVGLADAPFNEGVGEFDTSNESDQYEVAIRCETGCDAGTVSLHKAALWVSLHQLSKAEVIYRTAPGLTGISSVVDADSERTLIDLSSFSNPSAFFQAIGSTAGSSLAVTLESAGGSDAGTSGLTSISGSTLNFTGSTKSHLRSPGLTLPSGDRFMIEASPSGGNGNLVDSAVVIDSAR